MMQDSEAPICFSKLPSERDRFFAKIIGKLDTRSRKVRQAWPT